MSGNGGALHHIPPQVVRLLVLFVGPLMAMLLWPDAAYAAATCSASANSQYAGSYDGTVRWSDFASFVGCNTPSTTGTYAICSTSGQQPGSGGTSMSPWRQLASSGRTLNWQFYDSAHNNAVTDAGVQLGTINFTNIYYGSTQMAYAALVPTNATLVNGDYATTLNVPLELRRNNCSGAIETTFVFTFTFTVGVSNYCQVTGTQPLSFGLGRATTTQSVDAIGNLTVQCYYGSFQVTLSDGNHASGNQRRLSNGTDTLNYDIYTSADRNVAWRGTTPVSAVSNGSPATVSLYGRMPGQPTPSTGRYTDTIIATVTY